ncbi:MAG: aldehyde dehydrogenase family protein [Luteitalea sp.]|nr:aldehyde dehydrogenase family protein [Luteitalea sp.]
MLHIPLLRHGVSYRSLDEAHVPHHRTGQPFVAVSQANVGLIRRDLLPSHQAAARRALATLSAEHLLAICQEAADRFLHGTLPIGDDQQTPQDYIEQVSATTGMPYVLARRNMGRIADVLLQMRQIIGGLTRQLGLPVLDTGVGEVAGQVLSFFPRTQALAVVLPSNSPGVHALWTPAVPLKTPLVLKPGSAELWTPFRIAQAFIASGCPVEAFSYYPSDHAGAGEIIRQCGRSMFFGDASSVGIFGGDPRVELHGPGYTKILIGSDQIERWTDHLDLMVASIADNGGRSCVNASGIWVPARGREIAEALASRLAAIVPREADDPEARIAPFTDPRVATWVDNQIEAGLREPGAIDLTAGHRRGPRAVQEHGCTYMLPTIVYCDSPGHPLANREFLFPFASVVEMGPEEMARLPEAMGPTLVVTALTSDRGLLERLIASSLVDRLNVGPIATNQIAWDQPHEGNLFEHLYARRAFQQTAPARVSATGSAA